MSFKHCVVNFSDGHFRQGQDRLVKSLHDTQYQGDIILFQSHTQLGCKPHTEVPYQFKVYAIMEAYRRGYDVMLYCDASIWAIKNIMPCLYDIEQRGHLLEYCGWPLGSFCTDAALNEFGITRDQAFDIHLHSAGFTGLDFRNPRTMEFLNRWFDYAQKEVTFKGPWNNANNACSADPRCLGHRHDQSVASYLAHVLEMERINPTWMQYDIDGCPTKESSYFLARGV